LPVIISCGFQHMSESRAVIDDSATFPA